LLLDLWCAEAKFVQAKGTYRIADIYRPKKEQRRTT